MLLLVQVCFKKHMWFVVFAPQPVEGVFPICCDVGHMDPHQIQMCVGSLFWMFFGMTVQVLVRSSVASCCTLLRFSG